MVTACKESKYGVFSSLYFPAFGQEKTTYLDTLSRSGSFIVLLPFVHFCHTLFTALSACWF